MTDENEVRLYGVTFGNGNDGVSHMFPSYYVRTNDPWMLINCAVLASFTREGWDFVIENLDVEGDSDYTISGVIYDPPSDEQDVDVLENDDGLFYTDEFDNEFFDTEDEARDYYLENTPSWSAGNGAWFIAEVFWEVEDEIRCGIKVYDSIEDAYLDETIKKAKEDMNI